MIKLTVLYGHPIDTELFETYYANIHRPIAAKMSGFTKVEYTKFTEAPNDVKPAYYRMAEFWFSDVEALQTTMASHEGQMTAADLGNFATGGVTLLTGVVEN